MTEKTDKNNKEKTSIRKHDIAFLDFLLNIAFAILASSCFNNLINPQTLSDARRRFFKRWLAIAIFEFQFFLEADSKLVFTKFKANWVLFLLRNLLVCGYWCFAENQFGKITGFVKNSEKEYGCYGSNPNSLPQHRAIY